jgi:uroporphyrinogen-III synthase
MVRKDLARGVHVVVFTSPSAVEGLRLALDGDLEGGLARCAVVAAGRTTAGALAHAGVKQVSVAGSPDPEGLVDACGQAV